MCVYIYIHIVSVCECVFVCLSVCLSLHVAPVSFVLCMVLVFELAFGCSARILSYSSRESARRKCLTPILSRTQDGDAYQRSWFAQQRCQLRFWFDEMDDADLKLYFGSVFHSCTTLFRALMNGFDWSVAADALLPLGEFWVQLFHLYIAFCGLAVLNVITGVFVNSAIKTREKDHETLMQNMYKLKDLVGDLWKKLDKAGAGKITITEFERMFEEEDMRAFFGAIEMNAMDAWTLFDSLDADGDHLISFEALLIPEP